MQLEGPLLSLARGDGVTPCSAPSSRAPRGHTHFPATRRVWSCPQQQPLLLCPTHSGHGGDCGLGWGAELPQAARAGHDVTMLLPTHRQTHRVQLPEHEEVYRHM